VPVERFNEPLGWVEARFERGEVSILRFQWHRKEFVVRATHAHWVDRMADPVRHGYSVSATSGEVFELLQREGDPLWTLVSVAVK